ncbi:MAG TPA: carboxypeptidase-like regulatory domain-containing protein [Candidatus Sulfotelmatobacter sp.]|jgi:hypothetical protein|nr:carboxypeptidase-like regulatory domain-containing protein [Candidatus Sulfotelmatobacter sp.]
MFFEHIAIRKLLAVAVSAGLTLPVAAAGDAGGRADAAKPANPKHSKKSDQPPRSTLEGRVYGADGKKGLKGAVVEVRPLDASTTRQSAPSDGSGRYRVSGLDYGWAEVVVRTDAGEFLGDQAVNLLPGKSIIANFSLLETGDKPESWWKDRSIEPPPDLAQNLSGMAAAQQKLTGVEYWKSPKGIAILAGASVAALALIAVGGRKYTPPATTSVTPTP